MATKRLQWMFELYDRMSPSAKRIGRELQRVEKELRRVEMAERRLAASKMTDPIKRQTALLRIQRDELKHLADTTKRAGDGWGWFGLKLMGWVSVARTALSLVGGLGRGAGRLVGGFLGQGIKAASFKESTMLGLNMMLRNPATAKALYTEAVNFADISPFETQPVLQWYRMLTPSIGAAGVGSPGGSRILKVLAGLGDIAASQPEAGPAMDRIMLQISQMLSKGRLLGNDLRPLSEAGVNVQKVYEILAKGRGISLQEAQSPKWEGRFGSGEALQAILGFSAETFGGGVLGGGMGPASKTFQGLMSTLTSRPYRLMEDLGNTGGFKSLKSALSNLVDVLDPATPSGARIKKNIEELFDRILGGVFKRFEDPRAVEAWINSLLQGFEKLIPKIGQFADKVGTAVERLGAMAQIVNDLLPGGSESKGNFRRGTHTEGLQQRLDIMRRTRGMGALEGWLRTGKTPGQIDDAVRRVEEELLKETGGASRYPPAARPVGSPTGMNFGKGSIQINVNGAQNPQAVGDEVEDRLTSVLERLAMQTGAA